MEAEFELFPHGELEGAPVLAVKLNESTTAEQLITQALRNKRPGLRALWLKDAPWGDLDLDTALLKFLGDERTQGLGVVAMRDLDSEHWSQLALYWIADVTKFLGEPCTMLQLEAKIAALRFYPQVREIVLRQPPVTNLKPGLLDEVYAHLNPDGVGSIYCPPGDYEYRQTAMVQATRCATPWVVRFDHEPPRVTVLAEPGEEKNKPVYHPEGAPTGGV